MATEFKKVLIIAPYFVPRRRVGSLRPFKFSVNLKKFKWDPALLVIKTNEGTLTTHEQELLSEIEVHEISTPLDRTNRSGGQLKKHTSTKENSATFTEWLSRFIDRNYPIDTWLPFFFMKYRFIKKVLEETSPDLIFSTGDPWSAHWVGYKLNKDYGIPWVADFRDPWTLTNVNLKERTWFSSRLDKWWEKKVMKNASWLTFTSEKTTELYQKEYPEITKKSSCIYNSFADVLYTEVNENTIHINLEVEHLNLVFWGQFRKLSPIKPVVQILKVLKKIAPKEYQEIKFHSFGTLSQEDKAEAEEAGVLENFKIHEPVPPENALGVLNKADILFVSTDMARKDIIPAKLWDYLAAIPPILSIAPNFEIKDILDETKCGVQFDLNNQKDELITLLLACLDKKRNNEKLPLQRGEDKARINKFNAVHTTRQLAEIFEQVT